MRTSEQSREYGNLALLNNKEHFGVKGPCALSNIMPDFIAGTAIDKMHCVDNGVVKKLLSLWFDSAYILSGIMQNIYFEHFMLLITSIAYLTADSISNEMIDNAQILLNKFVHDFETLYGLQNCSINVHSLLHLPELVRRIRPLWSTSCYVFEDLNGQFLKLIHGTRHIDSQIASTHGQVLRMQQYQEQLPDGPVRDFCISKKYGVKICEKLFRHCYSVGTYSYFDDFPPFLHRAVHHLLPIRNIKKYYRLLKDGKLYISDQYSRDLKTISSDVQYIDNTGTPCFGRIYCFTKITECKCLTACHCNGIH
ncbi:GSCOCG00011739001-RA-CDS, partial [Cotesia congregata]